MDRSRKGQGAGRQSGDPKPVAMIVELFIVNHWQHGKLKGSSMAVFLIGSGDWLAIAIHWPCSASPISKFLPPEHRLCAAASTV